MTLVFFAEATFPGGVPSTRALGWWQGLTGGLPGAIRCYIGLCHDSCNV